MEQHSRVTQPAGNGPDIVSHTAHDDPVISVEDVGVYFTRGRKKQGFLELLKNHGKADRPDAFWALRNITFDVKPGEAIGVVGRNGQGKSTLLKVVAGVLIPDEGQARVKAGVAPLIEITGGFAPDLTGRQNIYLAGGLHGMSKAAVDEKFDEIIAFSEIEEFLDTPFRHYSSGMKVRLAFSVISQLEAPILLVDEVLAVGDKSFRDKCHARIEEMLEEGRTLFLVSHSAGDLKRFCDRGIYLRKGELVADAPIKDVLKQYSEEG